MKYSAVVTYHRVFFTLNSSGVRKEHSRREFLFTFQQENVVLILTLCLTPDTVCAMKLYSVRYNRKVSVSADSVDQWKLFLYELNTLTRGETMLIKESKLYFKSQIAIFSATASPHKPFLF